MKSAQLAYDVQQELQTDMQAKIRERVYELNANLIANRKVIERYRETELPLAEEITRTALKEYQLKTVDFLNFANSLEAAVRIEAAYFEAMYDYHKSYLELVYFTNY